MLLTSSRISSRPLNRLSALGGRDKVADETQVEFLINNSEKLSVQLGGMADWVSSVVGFTLQINLDTAAMGSPFNKVLANALQEGPLQLQNAHKQLQARSIEPSHFQVEVQALIDRRSIIVPVGAVAATLARLRESHATTALVAQAHLAEVQVLRISADAVPSAEMQGALFRGLAWAEVLKRELDRGNTRSLGALVEAAVTTEVGKLSGSVKAATDLALNKLSEEAAASEQREQTYEVLRKTLEGAIVDATAKLKGLEESYRFQGSVKAAFEHWDAKATDHRSHAWTFMWLFLLVLVVWAGAVSGVVYWVGGLSAKFEQIPYTFTAILAFISLLGFWGGRLLVRQYLSERHLGEDAAERSALIKTFASMLEGRQIAADRTEVVLGALFRSAATGLLAGDGSPTVPTDLIGKFLDRSKN